MRHHGEKCILGAIGAFGQRAPVALQREGLLALSFELPSKRDVACNLCPSNDPPTPVLDGGHRKRDVDAPAVLRYALRLEVIDSFASDECPKNRCLFLQSV